MSVNEEVIPLLVHDYKHQNIHRLETWFERFPDAYALLAKGLKEAPLKAALRDRLWLVGVFLLSHPRVEEKTQQVEQLFDHTDPFFPLIVQANVHGRASAKFELLEHLMSSMRSN